jgi:ABC-type sugar transport system permease subunit
MRSSRRPWALLVPAQSLLVLLLFLPALYVFWLSLTRSTYG